jgi:hypothetical protein
MLALHIRHPQTTVPRFQTASSTTCLSPPRSQRAARTKHMLPYPAARAHWPSGTSLSRRLEHREGPRPTLSAGWWISNARRDHDQSSELVVPLSGTESLGSPVTRGEPDPQVLCFWASTIKRTSLLGSYSPVALRNYLLSGFNPTNRVPVTRYLVWASYLDQSSLRIRYRSSIDTL